MIPKTPAVCRLVTLAVVLGAVLCASRGLGQTTNLLSFGSGWGYFDLGFEPAPDWAQPSYDDGDWPSGNGKFGYGNGDENTIVSYGPDDEDKHVTTYFRTWVYVPDLSR